MIALWIGGCAIVGLIAWVCLRLQLQLATAGFCMLIAIVLLSLLDSFVSSAIFSVAGALLLNVCFTPPIFSFAIAKTADLLPLVAFLVTSIAVTSLVREIRRAEQIQREQARLLNLTHDAVFVRETDGVIRYWNQSAEDLYGWPRDEAVGKPADTLLKSVYPIARDRLQQTLFQSGYWEGELVHTRRDGTQIIVSSRWTLQRDDKRKPRAILETDNDITGRKRAEETIRKSQAQFLEEVQRLSRTGSLGWTAGTGTVFWSAQAYRIFEQDVSVVPTIPGMREQVHPDDLPVFDAMVAQIEAGGDSLDIEYRLRFPENRIKYLRVVGHSVAAQGGQRQFVGAVMDVTEARQTGMKLRQLENDLARTSRITVLGELSASIAHEVGQPLTAVVVNGDACLGWLHRTPLNIEEVERLVARMREDATRAADIVRRVRRLIKGTPPEMVSIDVRGLLQEVLVFLRPELEMHGCRVSTHVARDVSAVAGDRVQLQQVLVNLITNALQAMATVSKKHGLVLAAERGESDRVILSVQDNGPGITDEHLPHLFDAFFTTRADGMGMGLAIAASIVEAHGGRLWAVNNDDGGSTFSFTLKTA
nr:ATP-binding protein [Burkholderia sp. Ac-20365]